MSATTATVMAGIPATNHTLFRRIRFHVGDPVAFIEVDDQSTLILRDIEIDRATRQSRATEVKCPKDFAPTEGLSGDRETATAQATAECLRRAGVTHVRADRSLPLLFAHQIERAGIEVECDPDFGVLERRAKDEEEIGHLRAAQAMTERAIELACSTIARASAGAGGVLMHDGDALTSERMMALVDVFLLEQGYHNPMSIVAGGPIGADCHDRGSGPLRTGEPVIVDIFPCSRATRYNGDCTRTVVHGDVPEAVARMHAAVVDAKAAAIAITRAGTTGDAIHAETTRVITAHGYAMGLPGPGDDETYCAMTHGTGHGVGLDVHEPPLLDVNGPTIVSGDILTIEPGLYCRAIGGLRVEDMVVVREDGCENFNVLHEGLDWF